MTPTAREPAQPARRQTRDVSTWCYCEEDKAPKLLVATRPWKKQLRPRRDQPGRLPRIFRGAPLPVLPLREVLPQAGAASSAASPPAVFDPAPTAPAKISLENIWEILQTLVKNPPPPPPAQELFRSPLLLPVISPAGVPDEAPVATRIPEPMEDAEGFPSEDEEQWLACPLTPDPYREDKGPKQD